MSMNNYILNLLNIEDKNIFILPNIEEKFIKNKKYKVIEGFLTYIPDFCPCCGCVNKSHYDIIKWGYRKNQNSQNFKLFFTINSSQAKISL